jgi:hypothetical protein
MVCTSNLFVSSLILVFCPVRQPSHGRTSSLSHFTSHTIRSLSHGPTIEQVSVAHFQLTLPCTNAYMMVVALAYEDIVPPNVTTETGCLSKFESLEDH